ncbi:MAG: DUF2752 domain-containing protein [Defluviitaleaceae bacterium]|nr:DUF2752 domain-containing protein [Defluviitaleaceae bacterium]
MSLRLRIILAIIMPLVVLAGIFFFDTLVAISQLTGDSRLYYDMGIQCPACGGTRSAAALLRGDIVRSFLYNPIVIFACLLALAFYTEFVLKIFNVHIKIVPRSQLFIWITLALFVAFYVGRNIAAFI